MRTLSRHRKLFLPLYIALVQQLLKCISGVNTLKTDIATRYSEIPKSYFKSRKFVLEQNNAPFNNIFKKRFKVYLPVICKHLHGNYVLLALSHFPFPRPLGNLTGPVKVLKMGIGICKVLPNDFFIAKI